jgi:hypothetical protein
MTGPSDYQNEMGRPDDEAIEALLAGQLGPDSAEMAAVAGVAEDLRRIGQGAVPRPSHDLHLLLTEGRTSATEHLFADKGDLPVTAASNVHGPAVAQVAGLPTRRSRMKNSILGMTGRLAGLGAAAKLAVAASVVAASAGGAAAVALAAHNSPAHRPPGRSITHHSSTRPATEPGAGISTESPSPEPTDTESPDPAETEQPSPEPVETEGSGGSGSTESDGGSGDSNPSAQPSESSGSGDNGSTSVSGSSDGGSSDGGSVSGTSDPSSDSVSSDGGSISGTSDSGSSDGATVSGTSDGGSTSGSGG